MGPVDQAWLARYSQTSGDDNPLHAGGMPNGLSIVQGNLIACLIEEAAEEVFLEGRVGEIAVRFLMAIPADSVLTITLCSGGQWQDSLGSFQRVRALVVVGGKLRAIADLRIETD